MITLKPTNAATAYFQQFSLRYLEEALKGPADLADCQAWDLTAQQWREQIKAALAVKRGDQVA
ncbi:MAG: hypothetical protein ABWY06_25070 [Pseudomonas sp.]|uniref:hypothetical protein n=1 Tax=Pseudomonas sp. TaxID=306 RepID=UPI003391D0D3